MNRSPRYNQQILSAVMEKIEAAGIWIPDGKWSGIFIGERPTIETALTNRCKPTHRMPKIQSPNKRREQQGTAALAVCVLLRFNGAISPALHLLMT